MRTATAYSSGFVSCLVALILGCGGGGEPATIEEAQEPTKVYVPAMDYLLPVPAEWGPTDAAFEVWIRGNFVEVAS